MARRLGCATPRRCANDDQKEAPNVNLLSGEPVPWQAHRRNRNEQGEMADCSACPGLMRQLLKKINADVQFACVAAALVG